MNNRENISNKSRSTSGDKNSSLNNKGAMFISLAKAYGGKNSINLYFK